MAEIIGIFYLTFSQEDRCLLSLPVEAEGGLRAGGLITLVTYSSRSFFSSLLLARMDYSTSIDIVKHITD